MPVTYQHYDFDFDGEHFALDFPCIDVLEATVIKNHTGHGVKSWIEALGDLDPQAAQALMWICHKRMGRQVQIATLNFDVMAFLTAFGSAEADAPDPTQAGENIPA